MPANYCAETTQWIPFATEPQSIYIAVSAVNGLLSLVAITGNLVMILVILRNSSLRTPPFMMLCNLVISDLGVGLITQPLFIALRVAESKGDIKLSCKLSIAYSFTGGCVAFNSFFTITAISFERFLAVHLGLNYRNVSSVLTVRRMKVVIFLSWFVAMLVGLTYTLDSSAFYLLIAIVACLFLAFCAFNYLTISIKLYSHSARSVLVHSTDVSETKQRKPFNMDQYKKTLKSVIFVYCAHLICFIPYLCFTITVRSTGRTSSIYSMYIVTSTFVLANSAINPYLYYWRITEVQDAVHRLFGFSRLAVRQRETTPVSTSESML